MCLRIFIFTIFIALLGAGASAKSRRPAFSEKKFTINLKSTPLDEALTLIAAQAGLTLRTGGELKDAVSYEFSGTTLEAALDTMAKDYQFDYNIENNVLYVSKASAGGGPVGPNAEARSIVVQYARASELIQTANKLLRKDESLFADEINNNLIFLGSSETFRRIKALISIYDQIPSQIMIEARILETTKSFAQTLGVSWGDLRAPDASASPKFTGSISNPGPGTPNLSLNYLLGSTDGRLLETRIQVAENEGDAKIVSRPKVFALNNQKAVIHSGVTYNIKTLSAVSSSSSSSSSPGTVTGGLQEISAGLRLEVTPSLVGNSHIRLTIKIENSEPDEGSAVDGIPGIIDNSAETAIIVKDGTTAVMAGLLKNNLSKSSNGVPGLRKIPIIGWLFSSQSKRDQTTELMIFLTPSKISISENAKASLPPLPEEGEKKAN